MNNKEIKKLLYQYKEIEYMLLYFDDGIVNKMCIQFNGFVGGEDGTNYQYIIDEFEKTLRKALIKIAKEIEDCSDEMFKLVKNPLNEKDFKMDIIK